MNLTLQTFNASTITAYSARIFEGPHVNTADIIAVPRVNDTMAYAGKSFQPSEFDIIFNLGTASAQANRETIGKIFHTRSSTLGTLVANDTNDGSTPYYIECTPKEFLPIKGQDMRVKMWASDPVWKKVTATAGTISVAGTGTTNGTLTNNGNVDCYPVITITRTATGGEYSYRRHVIAYNPVAYAQPNYPLDVTGGGIDTNALAKDTTVSYQLNGAVTSGTSTSFVVDTPVGGGLSASGGYFMADNEQCSYTAITGGTLITGITRGINGTTAGTHADNTVLARSLIQANGNDIIVLYNGVSVPRWFGGTVYSDTTLKIWTAQTYDAKIELTLGTAIAASGVTTITFKNTTANVAALNKLPPKGILYLETEALAYTAKNKVARTVTIADSGRGIKDTTAATHAAGVTARWIPYDIVIQYGNMTADTVVQDETRKPVFSLDNSTNTNWRYDSADSVFADEAGLRAGAWKPSIPKGIYSGWYGGNQGTAGTDPITDMGAEITNFLSGQVYKTETAQIHWTLVNPAGFTSISSTGEKYKTSTATAWPTTRLQSSLNGQVWTTEWSETTPTAGTWTAWTHAAESVPTNTKYLRFEFFGAVQGGGTALVARNEVNLGTGGTMGVSMESTGVPQITVKTQATNAHINATLTNTATGDGLALSFPVAINIPITIDTENRTMSYEDRLLSPPEWTGNRANRQEWFRFPPGANPVTYVDTYGGSASIVFSYKERKNV